MARNFERNLEDYRFHCIKAARDFRYPKEAIDRIKKAKTEREISDIMKAARKGHVWTSN